MQKTANKKKGFSLVELVVVVAIIGILVAAAIPSYKRYQDNVKTSMVKTSLHRISKSYLTCITLSSLATDCDSFAKIGFVFPEGASSHNLKNADSTRVCFVIGATEVTFNKSHVGCIEVTPNNEVHVMTFQDGKTQGICGVNGVCK